MESPAFATYDPVCPVEVLSDMNLKVSLVLGCYNMARELPRTIRSLSPIMQKGIDRSEYEIIVVDNGSTVHFDERVCLEWGANIQVLKFSQSSPSPAHALNVGIKNARGDLIGVLIDGARMASPGIIAGAITANTMGERTVVATLGFHLGSCVQPQSVLHGYNQLEEDRLLEQSGWLENGYHLFDISVLALSAQNGWFRPISESNALFMRRALWDELDGFDERFQSPGGGLANLDLFTRAVELPNNIICTLLGEGTFHQVHGGIATNSLNPPFDLFFSEYRAIRGCDYQVPQYRSLYLGSMPENAMRFVDPSR